MEETAWSHRGGGKVDCKRWAKNTQACMYGPWTQARMWWRQGRAEAGKVWEEWGAFLIVSTILKSSLNFFSGFPQSRAKTNNTNEKSCRNQIEAHHKVTLSYCEEYQNTPCCPKKKKKKSQRKSSGIWMSILQECWKRLQMLARG